MSFYIPCKQCSCSLTDLSALNQHFTIYNAILKGDQRELKGDQREFLKAPFKSLVNQYYKLYCNFERRSKGIERRSKKSFKAPFKSLVNQYFIYQITILKGDQRELKGDQRKD